MKDTARQRLEAYRGTMLGQKNSTWERTKLKRFIELERLDAVEQARGAISEPPTANVKFTAPRAKVPLCWICDTGLWGGGRSYVLIMENGHPHPTHKQCAKDANVPYEMPPQEVAP